MFCQPLIQGDTAEKSNHYVKRFVYCEPSNQKFSFFEISVRCENRPPNGWSINMYSKNNCIDYYWLANCR